MWGSEGNSAHQASLRLKSENSQ